MRVKIGQGCWFTHRDGRIIEGVYRGRHRIDQTTAFKRTEGGFEETVTQWTLPRHMPIHGGRPPQKGGQ